MKLTKKQQNELAMNNIRRKGNLMTWLTFEVGSTKIGIDPERGIAIMNKRLFDPARLGQILPTGEIVWSDEYPDRETLRKAMSYLTSVTYAGLTPGHIQNSVFPRVSREVCELRAGTAWWWNHWAETFGSFVSSDPVPVNFQIVPKPGK